MNRWLIVSALSVVGSGLVLMAVGSRHALAWWLAGMSCFVVALALARRLLRRQPAPPSK